jgi:hypothetical protein
MPVSTDQMALVSSPVFTTRMQYLMVQQASVVLAETGVGATHAARARFAASVVLSPAPFSSVASVMVVSGVNLTSTAITGVAPNVDSAATDAQILSQIATFWNKLAGIDTGN